MEGPYQFTKTVPPGTENLPLRERLAVYLDVFESGCCNTDPAISENSKPEECPVCVRAFVEAIKKAVEFKESRFEQRTAALKMSIEALREIATKNGPLHAYWDGISELEQMLLEMEKVVAQSEEITSSSQVKAP